MNKRILKLSILTAAFAATVALAQDKVPLKTELPPPLFVGTPVPINVPNLEPPIKGERPAFMVPVGTTNLALNKKVTSSSSDPVMGTLDLITDGDKAGDEGSWVELDPGKQWVQIDLAQGGGHLRRPGLALPFAGARLFRRGRAGFGRPKI